MTTYDRDKSARLVEEARSAHAATHGEEPPCTCADILAARDQGIHEAMCLNKAHRDAHVDAWLWKEANLADLADQLEAAGREVERMRRIGDLAFDAARDQHTAEVNALRAEVERMRTEQARLEAEIDELNTRIGGLT